MKLNIIVMLFFAAFVFPTEARGKTGWLSIKNSVLFENLPSNPIYEGSYSPHYSLSFVLGGTFSEYFGLQYLFSAVPPSMQKEHTDILSDLVFLLQGNMDGVLRGIRPYAGIGYGSKFSFGGTGILSGYGIAAQTGVRFLYKNLLIGIGCDYNYYFYAYHSNLSGNAGNQGTIKFSTEIGFVF